MAYSTDLYYTITKSAFRKERKKEKEREKNGYCSWGGFIPVFVGGHRKYYSGHNGSFLKSATEWYYDAVPAISLADRSIWLIDIIETTSNNINYGYKKPTGKIFKSVKDLI